MNYKIFQAEYKLVQLNFIYSCVLNNIIYYLCETLQITQRADKTYKQQLLAKQSVVSLVEIAWIKKNYYGT